MMESITGKKTVKNNHDFVDNKQKILTTTNKKKYKKNHKAARFCYIRK